MDVSEPDFGFSLMNDCKYGHSVDEHSVALTLLKSSTEPNPTADQEMHYFTYSIVPHDGDWRSANTPELAYRLNIPVTAVRGNGAEGALGAFAQVDAPNVRIESVKRGLKEEATVIRLYECFGERGDAPKRVRSISLMEDILGEVAFEGNVVEFDVRPYEIVSFMVD